MDIHTHILPGVDDGSGSMEETLKMLEQAWQEGIRVLIATPHYGKWNPDYNRKEAETVCRQVRERLRTLRPDMKIFMGNELYYTPGVLEDLQAATMS